MQPRFITIDLGKKSPRWITLFQVMEEGEEKDKEKKGLKTRDNGESK